MRLACQNKVLCMYVCMYVCMSHIFEISEDDHPLKIVGHARNHWWTLDFANAFISPGLNSQEELVPSPRAYTRNGAPHHWLRESIYILSLLTFGFICSLEIETHSTNLTIVVFAIRPAKVSTFRVKLRILLLFPLSHT